MSTIQFHHVDIPTWPEEFGPGDQKWVYFSWYAACDTSQFILPDGWTLVDERTGEVTVGDDRALNKNSNGVLLTTNAPPGKYLIKNVCTFANGETDTAMAYVKVRG